MSDRRAKRVRLHARKGRSAVNFIRFTPKNALSILLEENPTPPIKRPWALMCSVFWALYDNRARRRADLGKDKFNSADGRRGGNLYLLYTLHSNSDGENIRKAPFLEALTMLMHTEGFANAIVGYPAAEMTKRYAERKVAINNARATVRYLIAVEKISAKKRRMKFARLFMIQVGAFGHYSSDPLLQKNWESYKRNSPILYALFKEPTFDPEKFQKLSWAVKWVDATARDREAILRILGVAASVADMIKKVTKRFDVSIYSRVARVPWHDESFTAQERDFVIQL